MKQKFSTIFLLLLLLLAGSRVVAQNAPKPFDIEQPSLRVFLPAPELATGRAVVACPGGGYSHLAFEHEGCDWAPYFNKQGIALIVLKYRMPKGDRTLPISDAEAAMKVVRDSADVWNLNPNDIGIMGSSAGGHLATAAATLAQNRPNAAILGYAVTSQHVQACNPNAPETISAVDRKTPPCFVFATRTDSMVPINNSIDFMRALSDNGVAFESHIYAYGPHGFSTCESSIQDTRPQTICSRVPHWVEDSIGWLKDIFGECTLEGMTDPLCPAHINDNYLDYLTVDCTFAHVMAIPEAATLLAPMIDTLIAGLSEQAKGMSAAFDDSNGTSMVSDMKLRDLLAYGKISDDELKALDNQLRQISVI